MKEPGLAVVGYIRNKATDGDLPAFYNHPWIKTGPDQYCQQ